MKAGAVAADAYLSDWRRGEPQLVEGDIESLADAAVADVEAAYRPERLQKLIAGSGLENL